MGAGPGLQTCVSKCRLTALTGQSAIAKYATQYELPKYNLGTHADENKRDQYFYGSLLLRPKDFGGVIDCQTTNGMAEKWRISSSVRDDKPRHHSRDLNFAEPVGTTARRRSVTIGTLTQNLPILPFLHFNVPPFPLYRALWTDISVVRVNWSHFSGRRCPQHFNREGISLAQGVGNPPPTQRRIRAHTLSPMPQSGRRVTLATRTHSSYTSLKSLPWHLVMGPKTTTACRLWHASSQPKQNNKVGE